MATHKSSSVTIDEYELPKGGKRVGTLVLGALLVLSARRKFIEPRSIIHDHLLARSAKAARYSKPVQDAIFYSLFGLHSVETIAFAVTQLRKHNVKIFSPAWLKWLVTVFIGGIFATKHWEEVVEQKEIKAIKEI